MVSLIPKHEAEVENFQSVVRQSCFDFEKKMELFGLLELPDSDPDAGGLLMQAVKEIPTKFLAARSAHGDLFAKCTHNVLFLYL